MSLHYNFIQIGLGTNRNICLDLVGAEDGYLIRNYFAAFQKSTENWESIKGISIEPVQWLYDAMINRVEKGMGVSSKKPRRKTAHGTCLSLTVNPKKIRKRHPTTDMWRASLPGHSWTDCCMTSNTLKLELDFLNLAMGNTCKEAEKIISISEAYFNSISRESGEHREYEYLANMSQVGQETSRFQELEAWFNTVVERETSIIAQWDFQRLVQQLNIKSFDVLAVDTEGYDCQIVDSMRELCSSGGLEWPSLVVFETQGFADVTTGEGTEIRCIQQLVDAGYDLVELGNDAVLIRRDSPVWSYYVAYLRCAKCLFYPYFSMATPVQGCWFQPNGHQVQLSQNPKGIHSPDGRCCFYICEYCVKGDSKGSSTKNLRYWVEWNGSSVEYVPYWVKWVSQRHWRTNKGKKHRS